MGVFALAYGVMVYAAFFAAFLYLIVFVGGDALGGLLPAPKTLDAGASPVPAPYGVLVNIALLLGFGLQHTIMARQGFKRAWTRIVPKCAERSTFVLATTAVLIALFWFWTPLPTLVWRLESPLWTSVLLALFAAGWALVLLSTFLINHFELFGLAQTWRAFKRREAPPPRFMTPLLYKGVRHPLYLGFLIAFWSTPVMTAGHLLFAAIWSGYIFVAIGYEERDLVRLFGERYRQYQARVPMILPFGRGDD